MQQQTWHWQTCVTRRCKPGTAHQPPYLGQAQRTQTPGLAHRPRGQVFAHALV
eukprot:CAMPEP_0168364396 /NCGR_PEP_ID=MMETSP0228-20121227/4185_1 /TAXON_ID=133427 /ORGANISM="Protoceratium reticulatum, Strain CCCM 535 (=CCMP 1889)" /LENGTH=52 /DNA_ID=CAMNT_0008377153 /DNA_START=193 /DNA_END=351 /DNA_ORIENTATION=+